MKIWFNDQFKWVARSKDGAIILFKFEPLPLYWGGEFVGWRTEEHSHKDFHELDEESFVDLFDCNIEWLVESKRSPQSSLVPLEFGDSNNAKFDNAD